jgi:hypothetical protein
MQPTASEPVDAAEIEPPLMSTRPPRPRVVLPMQNNRFTVPPVVCHQNELHGSDNDADNIAIPTDDSSASITEPQPPPQSDLPMQENNTPPAVSLESLSKLLGDNFDNSDNGSDNESDNESKNNDDELSPKELHGRESIHDPNFEAQVIYEAELLEKEPQQLGTENEPEECDSSSDNGGPTRSETSATARTRRPQQIRRKRQHQGFRNWRKSMQWRKIEKRDQDLAALKQDLGQACIDHIKTLKTPADRRPFLAAIVDKHGRKTACALLEMNISRQEWWRIGIHTRYPGAFKPVEKEKRFCCRVDSDVLRKLVSFLNSPGNLQQYAFGTQVREILGGTDSVHLDNVSRLKNLDKLVGDFIISVISEMDAMLTHDLPDTENRCICLERHSMRRCMKERKHSGKCNFTPKGSVSASTIRDLIESFTAGDIKSLSGLDDVRVLKGRDNFKSLRVIAKKVCKYEDVDVTVKKIDNIEIFYQTDYVPHLARVESHRCNCLTCGFNDRGTCFSNIRERGFA